VRALWYARDTVATRRDTAPGRVLPDAAIVAAAEMNPKDERELLLLPGFGGRSVRRLAGIWLDALAEARALPDDALPTTPQFDGPPPPHRWADKDPAAADRLTRCREVVIKTAELHQLPPENLITPEFIRRLAWEPPSMTDAQGVREALTALGARQWQCDLLADELAQALTAPAAVAAEVAPEAEAGAAEAGPAEPGPEAVGGAGDSAPTVTQTTAHPPETS
jgi:ribonuclease D